MSLTPEITDEVLRLYRQNTQRFSPFKVSKALGVSISEVLAVVENNRELLTQGTEVHGGMGRPDIQPFLVARKKGIGAQWDNNSPAIADARAQYEAGTHEMMTGRDGPWQLLYSFPREVPAAPRPGYFNPEIS